MNHPFNNIYNPQDLIKIYFKDLSYYVIMFESEFFPKSKVLDVCGNYIFYYNYTVFLSTAFPEYKYDHKLFHEINYFYKKVHSV